MIKKLLIANRGEIAVRVIRACKELGIKTVAVYSTADKENLHVKLADEAYCIGPASSAKSYLDGDSIITVALRTGAEAIHPGVGFLSENAAFARDIEKSGIIWIGPKPETIELLGDKVQARATATKYGLPVTPGSKDAIDTFEKGKATADKCGYPVIIKAASGGGGKGMRIVWKEEDLAENLKIASSEALSNFADGTVYIEKYIQNPRHVELQIIADGKGNVGIMGERDCSVQKNHQKLIEESPSPAVTPEMRARMYEGAKKLFSGLKYRGAGTIEFLVTGGEFYFMEVNARVQVEHPVSEFVSGVDLIREQILACTENRLSIDPEKIQLKGWSIEARINARAPGKITKLMLPSGPGVRFDSFIYESYSVVPHYDSMLAKLIVHDDTREAAIRRLNRCLNELVLEGIPTNQQQQVEIINTKQFKSGDFGTSLYEELYGDK